MKLHLPLTYLRIVVAIAVSFLLSSSFTVYGQACQFQQGQNGGVGLPVESPVQFERGNSNGSKSHFAEGYSVPYRIEFTTLEANQQYRVRIAFDVKKNEKVSFDYITGFQNLQLRQSLPSELVDPLVGTGLASLSGISSSFLAIPAPTFTTNTSFNSTASASFSQLKTAAGLNPETSMPTSPYSASLRNKGNMVIWNATLNSIQYVGGVDISPATVSVAMDVVFTKANNANNVVLAWGGHIASLLDWGVGNSASSIPGSPYHMYVETVVKTSDGDVICNGNMDCQIAADAVTPVPTCNITGPSELCSSTTLVNYKAVLDASQNGPVSYNWSVVDLSSSSTAQLSGSVAGVSSIDTLLQAIIPSDSFLVRLRVQRGGIFNYCYLNSVDSPGTKVKKLNVEVQAQAMPTVISLNSASTSQLNATIQLNGSIVTTGFNYQWTIVGPGGFASGSLDSYSIPDPVFTASMAGDYTLKVIASQQAAPNCVDSATIVISVGSSQGCPSLLTQSLCNASQLSFPVSSLPQPDVDYSWSVTNGASILNEGGDSLLTVLAGAQDFDITLQLSYANPLLNNLVCTYPVIVHPLPIVTAGSYGPTCVTASPLSLSGLPAGGTWSGSGVSGSTFTPSVAGAGTIRIYYSYTDENGCSSVDSTDIVVNEIPRLDPGTYGPLCVSASPVFLQGTPAGGTWSGTGVSGSTFDPSVAGVGTHAVNYSVTITGGCVTDTTIDIEVKPLPNLDLGTYEPLCEEDEIITLTATPTGGTWSGTGTNGSTFNPALAGLGVHVLTYHYTDAFGCSAVQEVSIQVNRCAGINACTLTQGYYGSTNGNSCDEDSLYRNAVSIIKKLLTPSPIVIGSGARTLTITVADSARLNAVMPGGGTPFSFSHTGNITLQSSQFSLYKTSRGKINNILLSQTIALALNVRIKPDLAPFVLENGYIHTQRLRTCQNADLPSLVTCEEDSMAIRAWLMIPSVVNYLLANSGGTVADLLALANEVLGRTKVPGQAGAGGTVVPSLANIVAQVDIINNAFDQCRIFLGFFPTLNLCTSSSLRAAQQEEAQVSVVIKTLEVKVFPNPFGTTLNFNIQTPEKTKVTIELFDLQGKLLTQEYIGEFQSQENRIIQMKAPVVSAPILYRVTTSKKVFSGVLLPSR
ncbi:MAG: T9SS type A sorting domain-containing protein [Bacteroidota bacterium]